MAAKNAARNCRINSGQIQASDLLQSYSHGGMMQTHLNDPEIRIIARSYDDVLARFEKACSENQPLEVCEKYFKQLLALEEQL